MSTETAPRTPPHAAQDLDAFFRQVLQVNPFLFNAVTDPSSDAIDVETIHRREFDELAGYADETHRERGHIGQVVWGEPGIGKSHLLARLHRWAAHGDRALCVVLHNLQPSPEHLPRYVLKCVIQRLVRGRGERFHDTPLYWLAARAVKEGLRQAQRNVPISAREARAAYQKVVAGLVSGNPGAGPDARLIYDVLFRFFLGAWRAQYRDGDETGADLAVRWLQGDDLDRDEARDLGVCCGEDREHPVVLPGTQAVESVLVALAELAWLGKQPFILAFDQVDNLTAAQIAALSQFLHPLIDHARNLFVVVSGVQEKLLKYVGDQVILRAAWERIAQDERGIRLGRIRTEQARQLIEARLENFLEPFVTLPGVKERVQDDSLFPLGRAWFDQRTADSVDLRPRDVVNWSRDRWREVQRRLRDLGGPAWLARWADQAAPWAALPAPLTPEELARRIDEQTARRIGQQAKRREREPESLPADAANLAGLVETLLRQCLDPALGYRLQRVDRPEAAPTGRLPAYRLLLCSQEGNEGRPLHTGVAFLATANRTSAAAALRRIVEDDQPPERVVLVYDERLPLDLGPKGEEYLAALQARGRERFQAVQLGFHEYAELDALQAVVGDARSGDIEVDLPGGNVRRVSEGEAVASHHRNDRYRCNRLLALLLD